MPSQTRKLLSKPNQALVVGPTQGIKLVRIKVRIARTQSESAELALRGQGQASLVRSGCSALIYQKCLLLDLTALGDSTSWPSIYQVEYRLFLIGLVGTTLPGLTRLGSTRLGQLPNLDAIKT